MNEWSQQINLAKICISIQIKIEYNSGISMLNVHHVYVYLIEKKAKYNAVKIFKNLLKKSGKNEKNLNPVISHI